MSTPTIPVRLLAVSMLLPAIVIAIDSAVLEYARQSGWSTAATLSTFVLLWAQTAALSWSAGRWLPNWSWRLLLLAWSTILVDLLLYSVAIVGRSGRLQMGLLLAIAFLASQICATAVWAILGGHRWLRRWGLVPFAVAPAAWAAWALNAAYPWTANVWLIVALIQTVGAGAIATLLYVFGYRIECGERGRSASDSRHGVQFSMQHMLIWTACAAVLVTVFKEIVVPSSHNNAWQEWLQIVIEGIVLATLMLVAVWAATGAGRVWARLPVAIVLAVAAAALLQYLEAEFQARRAARTGFYWLPMASWLWYVWTVLAGAFLSAFLLVLRAAGYRLLRSRSSGG